MMHSDTLTVRDAMQPRPVCLRPDMPVVQAVALFIKHNISGAPVVDQHEGLVGVLTERDCIRVAIQSRYFNEPAGTVSDYMSTDVQTVTSDENLLTVAEKFTETPYRRFPVVTDTRLVGLIARRDVLRVLAGHASGAGGPDADQGGR